MQSRPRSHFLAAFAVLAASIFATAQGPAPASLPPEVQQRIERMERRLQDWPQLAKYAEANAKLAAPASKEKRVVFLGDSITEGWKLEEYFAGKPYINRGISAQTTPQMLVRFRPDVIALRPAMVVILAGINDLGGNTGPMTVRSITGNLQSMAELARANGIRVVMASVLPVHDANPPAWLRGQKMSERCPPAKIDELNAWIRQYATGNGHTYLDYFSAMRDRQGMLRVELADDGLHPNAAGYKIMAPLAEKAIAEALKRKR